MGRGPDIIPEERKLYLLPFFLAVGWCREVSGWPFARNCGVKWEKTNYIRNIPVHIRKPGVLPCLFCCSYVYTSSESAKRRRQIGISHLIFYQNLYLSYLWGVWVDLSLLCWGVFFLARYRGDKHKMAETFLWRIITFLLLLQWWRIYQLSGLSALRSPSFRAHDTLPLDDGDMAIFSNYKNVAKLHCICQMLGRNWMYSRFLLSPIIKRNKAYNLLTLSPVW